MSADIWLVDEHGETIRIDENLDLAMKRLVPMRESASFDGEVFNITHNLRPMLTAAGLPPWNVYLEDRTRPEPRRDGLAGLDGMRAVDAGPFFHRAAKELERDPEKYRAMNPPNGWGTYEQAVLVMQGLAAACGLNPRAWIVVHA